MLCFTKRWCDNKGHFRKTALDPSLDQAPNNWLVLPGRLWRAGHFRCRLCAWCSRGGRHAGHLRRSGGTWDRGSPRRFGQLRAALLAVCREDIVFRTAFRACFAHLCFCRSKTHAAYPFLRLLILFNDCSLLASNQVDLVAALDWPSIERMHRS